MRIITAGAAFLDIDAYAGCIAYAELLQLQGIPAAAVSTAPLNESITKTVQSWGAQLLTSYTPQANDTYTLIDVSDPAHFDTFVAVDRVDTVLDHHPGFEQFWQERIGAGTDIDFIGAACTLVFEHWQAAGLAKQMSTTSARLLVCGILDNTLHFGAKITTERDHAAYKALLPLADLPDDWPAQYFGECEAAILADVVTAVRHDTKILTFNGYDQPLSFGQLAVWNTGQVLDTYADSIADTLSVIRPDWFMNLISISERKSYFITTNPAVQAWLSQLLGLQFNGSVAVADRLWLRKEVIKQDIVATQVSSAPVA